MSIENDRTELATGEPPPSDTMDLSQTASAQRPFRDRAALEGSITRPPADDEHTEASEPQAPGVTLLRGEIVDRYVIISQLGQGGMGVVYAAYDPDLDRKIALKLLLPHGGGTHSASRLLREAQALARLAHPNVVAVHDVGVHGDQVWIAMEFVAGLTLGAWAQQSKRPWPEVLRVLGDAARGVAAAHAAGLVHRDLKPDNVMIGADGRVRVMDFGLAHGRGPADGELGTTLDPDFEPHTGPAALALPITRAGSIQGTPAYMAPEQWRGQEAQAATDQFGWSVMAWELLYGERPFAGDSRLALAASVTSGRRKPPPRGRSIPTWIRKIVERGLADDPARRWPSMTELLVQLGRGQTQARVRMAALVLGGLAICGIAALGWQRWRHTQSIATCELAGADIDGLWNDETRASLRAALVATGVNYAETTADKIMPWLDSHAAALEQARTQVCMRTEVEHTWDDDTRERATWCLDERTEALASLLTELTKADRGVVDRAIPAAAELRPVEPCLDAHLLGRLPTPPTEARADVRRLRGQLVLADTLQDTGQYARGLEVASAARIEAAALGWAPLSAALRMREGHLLEKTGKFEPAEAALTEAYDMALAAGAWEVATSAATQMIFLLSSDLARHPEAVRWAGHAGAVAAHISDPARLQEAQRIGSVAGVRKDLGDIAESRALYEQSLALQEQALGPEHLRVAATLHNLGMLHGSTGSYAEAQRLLERALEIRERTLGPEHPLVLINLSGLGSTYRAIGDLARARALQERVLTSTERSLGPEHRDVASRLNDLAGTLAAVGEFAAANALHERAIAIMEKSVGPEHPSIALYVGNMAATMLDAGETAKARPLFERALVLTETKFGPDHPNVGSIVNNLGDVLMLEGDLAGARAQYQRSLKIREKKLGVDNPKVALMLSKLAGVEVEAKHPAEALALLERAFKIYDAHEGQLAGEIDAHFHRARALVASGGDRTLARAEADLARGEMAKLGPVRAKNVAEVDAWIAENFPDHQPAPRK